MTGRAWPFLLLFGATVLFGGWAAILVALGALGRLPGPADRSLLVTLLTPPAWTPALLWLAANALLIWRLRPRPALSGVPPAPALREPPRDLGRHKAAPVAAPPPLPPSLDAILNPRRLVEAAALSRPGDDRWTVRGMPSTACDRLRVYVDHAPNGDGSGQRPIERLLLATLSGASAGQEITVPVVRRSGGSEGPWTWAEEDGDAHEVPAVSLRCRIAFACDGREEENVYFVLIRPCGPGGASSDPILVEEAAFAYKDAWEAAAPLARVPRWRGR